MSLFLRVFQHLLPRSQTWSLTFNKTIRKFFQGLAAPLDDTDPAQSPKAAADAIFGDIFPPTTRQRPKWLTQFGIRPGPDDATDIQQLTAAWQAQGGQSPRYLQDTLQAAGFNVFVHEWWQEGVPAFKQICCGDSRAQCGESKALAASRSYRRFVRNPRNYTQQPKIGTVQCGDSKAVCTPTGPGFSNQPQCNAFLANEPGYLVNSDLSRNAPPPIPDDTKIFRGSTGDWWPKYWPFFVYIGGQNFPDHASVPATRRAELQRLVLKLRPTHLWIVMLVDYTADGDIVTVDGVAVTVDGETVTA